MTDLAQRVKEKALELGFTSVGIAGLDPVPHGQQLQEWVDNGMHGEMNYMARQLPRRLDPARVARGAQRAVVVTRNYFTGDDHPLPGNHGRVAQYARRADYHDALRQPLDALAKFLMDNGASLARPYVDAGPVPERELAQRAGLGWIGKNTMLIDPNRGSYFFIASVFTDLELPTDEPFEADRCGTCTRCLEACPTGAFPEERVLDSRKCISYLTIEYRGGEIPEGVDLNGYLFGCDICQEVCPWNVSFAEACDDPLMPQEDDLVDINLEEFDQLSQERFDARFGNTPLERSGLTGMKRNARALKARNRD